MLAAMDAVDGTRVGSAPPTIGSDPVVDVEAAMALAL